MSSKWTTRRVYVKNAVEQIHSYELAFLVLLRIANMCRSPVCMCVAMQSEWNGSGDEPPFSQHLNWCIYRHRHWMCMRRMCMRFFLLFSHFISFTRTGYMMHEYADRRTLNPSHILAHKLNVFGHETVFTEIACTWKCTSAFNAIITCLVYSPHSGYFYKYVGIKSPKRFWLFKRKDFRVYLEIIKFEMLSGGGACRQNASVQIQFIWNVHKAFEDWTKCPVGSPFGIACSFLSQFIVVTIAKLCTYL